MSKKVRMNEPENLFRQFLPDLYKSNASLNSSERGGFFVTPPVVDTPFRAALAFNLGAFAATYLVAVCFVRAIFAKLPTRKSGRMSLKIYSGSIYLIYTNPMHH